MNNIPHSIELRLRRICDSDEKFKHRGEENKNYSRKLKWHLDIMLERKIQKEKR